MRLLHLLNTVFFLLFTFSGIQPHISVDRHVNNQKIVTVSTQPLDELNIYNDTPYDVTIVVHDANDENITYTITLKSNETFHKNARCHTAHNKRKLAKLLVADIEKKHIRMVVYPMRTQFTSDEWHSLTVQVNDLLCR